MSRDLGESSDHIVAATIEVLGEVGLKGATTRAIASRAGVNEVTLFRHFGSKKLLVAHAIEALAERCSKEIIYTGNIEADLEHVITEYDSIIEDLGPAFSTVITEVARDPEMRPEFDGIQRIYENIGSILRRYQEDGLLRDEPIDSLLMAFGGPVVVRYLSPLFKGARERAPFDAHEHVQRFLHGRSAR